MREHWNHLDPHIATCAHYIGVARDTIHTVAIEYQEFGDERHSRSRGDAKALGACLNSRCSILGESDSTLGYEQVFSPLEYRSDAASAAECAGLRAERPCVAVYR